MKVKSLSRVRFFTTPGLQPTRLLHPWDFLGKSTGMGCHFLLEGIFPTQGLNPGLPRCRQAKDKDAINSGLDTNSILRDKILFIYFYFLPYTTHAEQKLPWIFEATENKCYM